jgi:hypothetical protein
MDIAIIKYKPGSPELEFSGALRPLWIIKKNTNEITELKPDKHSIGGSYSNDQRLFTNHLITVHKEDCFYMSTDGYGDQFGGPQGKKMMTRNMKNFILSIHSHSMKEQQQLLEKNFSDWQQSREQIDDVLVAGFRI